MTALQIGSRLLDDDATLGDELQAYRPHDRVTEALDAGELGEYLHSLCTVLEELARGLIEDAPGWLGDGSACRRALTSEGELLQEAATRIRRLVPEVQAQIDDEDGIGLG